MLIVIDMHPSTGTVLVRVCRDTRANGVRFERGARELDRQILEDTTHCEEECCAGPFGGYVIRGTELARVEDASDRAEAKADALQTQEFLKAIAFEDYTRRRRLPGHNAGRKPVLSKHRCARQQDLF